MSNVIDLGKHMPRNKSDHDLKEVKQDDGTTIWTITISGMSDDEMEVPGSTQTANSQRRRWPTMRTTG